MSILIGFLAAVHIVVALILVVLVLMQRSKDQGVGAAFGGAVTETVFGAGTTTALVRMTIWCACILLSTSLLLAILYSRTNKTGGSLMQRELATPVAPSGPASQPATLPVPENTPATATPATPPPAANTTPAPVPESAPAPAPAPEKP